MSAKEKLIAGGFITEDCKFEYNFRKYFKYLDTIYDAVVDYGYTQKVVPEQVDSENIGRKDTDEFTAFYVKQQKKEEFEAAMKALNIYLDKEMLSFEGDNKEREAYTFKSSNIPELKQIIRGTVKTKQKEAATQAMLARQRVLEKRKSSFHFD